MCPHRVSTTLASIPPSVPGTPQLPTPSTIDTFPGLLLHQKSGDYYKIQHSGTAVRPVHRKSRNSEVRSKVYHPRSADINPIKATYPVFVAGWRPQVATRAPFARSKHCGIMIYSDELIMVPRYVPQGLSNTKIFRLRFGTISFDSQEICG